VDSVSIRGDSSAIFISNRGTMVLPAEIALSFADGSGTIVKLPIEMWNLGSVFVYRVPERKRVVRAEVDPRRALPDINRLNNAWPRGTNPPVR
jgi:hypothetical protein